MGTWFFSGSDRVYGLLYHNEPVFECRDVATILNLDYDEIFSLVPDDLWRFSEKESYVNVHGMLELIAHSTLPDTRKAQIKWWLFWDAIPELCSEDDDDEDEEYDD